MKQINIKDLVTYESYAALHTTKDKPLIEQRVRQLVKDRRLTAIDVDGRLFINKNSKVRPSKKRAGRPKKKA